MEYATQSAQVQEKTRQTNLEKYGVEHPSQNNKIKEKIKQNNIKKYGVEHPSQTKQVQDKRKKTCQKKYGVDCASKNLQVKDKMKQNNIKKYGVEYPIQLEEVKEKRRQNNINKWGTSNISTKHIDPNILEILHDRDKFLNEIEGKNLKTAYDIADYFGISYEGTLKILWELNLRNIVTSFTSKQEQELQKIFPTFKKNRKILYPLEIDLYNDRLKLGIEFNGNYWHSDKNKEKNYHQNKTIKALEKGIFIYHIFEYEWQDILKRKIIISQLTNLIGNNQYKIFARKCDIRNVSFEECCQFLNENHLQGKDQSSIRYGLFYEDQIVAIMTFCKPRFNKNYDWELSRYCCKCNYTVIGAASKLFKYFLKNNKGSIISYSNNAKTKGNMYNRLGFTFEKITTPNYVWIRGDETLSRYQTQKHLLKEFFNLGNTENEIMYNRGFLKVYDCGNKVWVMNR